jgi:phospholipid/cholesterol/gamma-HCH transport system substrate-binding protein
MTRPRTLEDRSTLLIGTVAVLALTALIGATTLLNALHLGRTSYDAEFGQAANLRVGDQVSIAGVPVGTVSATRLARDRVLVSMKIERAVVLRDQTRASIKLTTVLGSRYVELRPGGTEPLPGNRIPLANTAVPYDLQKLLQDSTRTFEDVDAQRFAESLQTVASQLHGVPAVLPEALANVENLAAVISERRGQISELLRNTATVAQILGNQQEDLAALITQGRELTGEIVARRAAVERLLQAATNLIVTADDLTGTNQAEIDRMLADIRAVTSMLGDHDALLRSLFQTLPISMRNVANATGTGPFLDFMLPGGLMVDSWMCAISGRAEQWKWPERYQYFKDCE